MPPNKFNPTQDIPSQEGKVFLITGGTAGLGAGTVETLVEHKAAHVYFTGRNKSAADDLISKLQSKAASTKITFIKCDQTSLASVRAAADEFLASSNRLDVLMCNAGVMAIAADTTKDGYEAQFGINHVAHALLIKLLLPTLLQTAQQPGADVRIINLSSIAYNLAPSHGIVFDTLKTSQASLGSLITSGRWTRYGQSKLANMLYSDELAKRNPQITIVSVHPGIIFTALYDNVPLYAKLGPLISKLGGGSTPVEEGHYTQVWAATCPKADIVSGEYYVPVGVIGKRSTKASQDKQLAEKLWDWTQKELSTY